MVSAQAIDLPSQWGHSSFCLFQQPKILVSANPSGLEVGSNDGDWNLIMGRDHDGPGNSLFHVGTVAAFLSRKPKSGDEEYLLQVSLMDGDHSGHVLYRHRCSVPFPRNPLGPRYLA